MVLTILTVVHVLAAITIIGLVLLQHGKGADAGAAFGAGSAGSIFGARGPASFLTRATAILATVFFLTSLSLAYLSGRTVERRSITERVAPTQQATGAPSDVPAESAPEGTGGTEKEGPGDVPAPPASDHQDAPPSGGK